MTPRRRVVVAIDGPSGAGKSTVARALARRLGILFLDTGAMYRAVALVLLRQGIDPTEEAGVARIVRSLTIRFSEDGERIFTKLGDGPEEDVSAAIRMPDVTARVSQVSALQVVREKLTAEQRSIAAGRSVVAEGRDTTTVVFPDADRKFFLIASLDERARRRHDERPELSGTPVAEVAAEIRQRDERDSSRSIAPLRQASDAMPIDTTGVSLDSVVDRLARICGADGV